MQVGPRLKIALLAEEDRAMLVGVRRDALQVLSDRGLLEGGSVEELSARPLGPYPRILDTGCDYAAGRSVAV